MKPWIHSLSSARKFGGKPEDYMAIHQMMDESKSHIADHRHRGLFHHSYGTFVMEKIFGVNILNSDGKLVSVRDVAEDHIIEDLGWIPSVQDYFQHMAHQDWMGGRKKTTKTFSLVD